MAPTTLSLRFPRCILPILSIALLCSATASAQVYHNPRRKTPIGFSVDLKYPIEAVLPIIQAVASDTIIRGSSIYAKDTELEDAEYAKSSIAFADSPKDGKVLFKVKTSALSPKHFPDDSDMGTVTVRYIVVPVAADRTHLQIDAVFTQDAGHTRFFSDGSVETEEYGEIMVQLKALDPANRAKRSPAAAARNPAQQTVGLQEGLAQEQARLEEAKAAVSALEKHVKQLEFDTQGRIKSSGVPLKASPYDHSSTIAVLDKGEQITVITTTKYWYRLRRASGQEGWIYYVFLEPLQ
jgi:Bacterial SH3 domain